MKVRQLINRSFLEVRLLVGLQLQNAAHNLEVLVQLLPLLLSLLVLSLGAALFQTGNHCNDLHEQLPNGFKVVVGFRTLQFIL